jgi:hypothetical protein
MEGADLSASFVHPVAQSSGAAFVMLGGEGFASENVLVACAVSAREPGKFGPRSLVAVRSAVVLVGEVGVVVGINNRGAATFVPMLVHPRSVCTGVIPGDAVGSTAFAVLSESTSQFDNAAGDACGHDGGGATLFRDLCGVEAAGAVEVTNGFVDCVEALPVRSVLPAACAWRVAPFVQSCNCPPTS